MALKRLLVPMLLIQAEFFEGKSEQIYDVKMTSVESVPRGTSTALDAAIEMSFAALTLQYTTQDTKLKR